MLFDSSLSLLAAIDRVLDPKLVESLRIFGIPPVIYMPLAMIAASIAVGYLIAQGLRLKDYGWKFSLILAAWTASIAVILFGQFKLGADLRGGVNLVYEVDEAKTALLNPKGGGNYDLDAVLDVLRRRLNPSGVKELVIRKSGPQQIEIVVPEVDKSQIDDIKKRVVSGGALRFMIIANDPTQDGQIIDAAREQAEDEQNKLSLTVKNEEGEVIGYWMKLAREDVQGRQTIDAPFQYASVLQDVIRDSRTGELITFTPAEQSQLANASQQEVGSVLADIMAERDVREVDVLLRAPDSEDLDVRGEDLATAQPHLGIDGWEINFVMKGEGIGKMGALTGQNLGPPKRSLAIVFDNELVSAPQIQSQITEQGRITGQFSEQEVRFMSELLKSGSMPVVLFETPIAENLIGSILGRDTIIKGSWSLAISLAAVLVVIALYYRFAGIMAGLALTLNLVMTVAIMIVIQAPFTLPGLAGLVLTLGMSIDANVLIFERIREETMRGAALRMALRNGYDKALSAIIDGNLTTLLTAIVLYVIGTDQLRGFGITLMLGNIISMFTAIFCTRVIFDAGERTRWLKSLSMTHVLTNPKIDWVKLFVPTTIASGILILIGLVATVARGSAIFDIDLKGGTTVTAMLREPLSDSEVRQALSKQFTGLRDQSGAQVDYQVYEISLEGEAPNTVYKIDSSLEKVAELENHVQQALRDPQSGQDGVRTYQMEYKFLSTGRPGNGAGSNARPAGNSPTDKGAGEDKAAADANSDEGASTCGQSEETAVKEEEVKETESDQPPAKTEDSKTTDPQGAKDQAKTEAATGAKSKTDEDLPKSDAALPPTTPPAGQPVPAAGPAATVEGTSQTTVQVRFPQNKISAYALEEHINQAAEKTLNQNPFVRVDNPDWDKRDNTAFETWAVTMALSEQNARKVIEELESEMEASPVWQNSSSVSGQVTLDMQLKALYAILVSLLGIAAFVWFRFQKLGWGIAGIAALVHDTLVMIAGIGLSYYVAPYLGFLGIQEFKISLTVVAGFLTLIGYSINDTIVIFDRIREIRGKNPHVSMQMVNDAVNQTLSRTLITGGLTLLVVTILYIWGGEGIHTFAFCMLIGVISGTYSTVFIAAPLLLWLIKSSPASAASTKTASMKQPVTTAGGRT